MMSAKSHGTNCPSSQDASDDQQRGIGSQLVAGITGALICAPPCYLLGSMSDHAILGTAVGAAIGAFLGCGLLNGFIGPLVVWIVGFTILIAIIGPGCDADPVSSALVGTALGWLFGLTGWRGFLVLFGALVGVNVGVSIGGASDVAGFFGLGLGAFLGFLIGYGLFPVRSWAVQNTPHVPREPSRNKSLDPSGNGGRDPG